MNQSTQTNESKTMNHQPNNQSTRTIKETIMHRIATLLILLTFTIGSSMAASATSITLEISFDLNDELAIAWADAAGGGNEVIANTWALNGIALGQTYVSQTHGTIAKRYIVNESPTDTDTDVYAQITGAPGNWNDGTVAADTYALKMDIVGGDTDFETTLSDSSQDLVINLVDADAASPKIEFSFATPSSIDGGSNGAGLSIVVTFTATAQGAGGPALAPVTNTDP